MEGWTRDNMTCPHCLMPCYIDEWEGWQWICVSCGEPLRDALDEEIEAYELELLKYNKKD